MARGKARATAPDPRVAYRKLPAIDRLANAYQEASAELAARAQTIRDLTAANQVLAGALANLAAHRAADDPVASVARVALARAGIPPGTPVPGAGVGRPRAD